MLGMFILACGPSKSEIAQREKFVADSVARVESIKREQLRIHLEKIEVGKGIKENYLKEILALNEKEILLAEIKLKKLNEFQLGRSLAVKEQQLSDQRYQIASLKELSAKIEREIAQVKLHQNFDFQKSPKGTLEAFFKAAKDGDTKNMRYLLDPYGEFSNDVANICFVEIYPSEAIASWRETFGKGRIMSEPKMENNLEHIEIAYGEQSNKLEEMIMVERAGFWYFLDF